MSEGGWSVRYPSDYTVTVSTRDGSTSRGGATAANTSNMEADIAADRLAKIKAAGLDKIRFAWAGEIEKGKKHYYIVQGPTFLIEYAQNRNNAVGHVHTLWCNFTGDFGGGVQWKTGARRAWTIGYRYHHVSNGYRADTNPGFDSNLFYVGFSIFR